MGNRSYQYSFKRDEKGNFSDEGTYSSPTLTKTSFKFPKQGRFSFGVASTLPIGAAESRAVGKRCGLFNYTHKNKCTIEVYDKYIREECSRVRALIGAYLPWYVDLRPANRLWMDNCVSRFEGFGTKKTQELVDMGIRTVADLKEKDNNKLLTLLAAIDETSHSKLLLWRDLFAHPGTCTYQSLTIERKVIPTKLGT